MPWSWHWGKAQCGHIGSHSHPDLSMCTTTPTSRLLTSPMSLSRRTMSCLCRGSAREKHSPPGCDSTCRFSAGSRRLSNSHEHEQGVQTWAGHACRDEACAGILSHAQLRPQPNKQALHPPDSGRPAKARPVMELPFSASSAVNTPMARQMAAGGEAVRTWRVSWCTLLPVDQCRRIP